MISPQLAKEALGRMLKFLRADISVDGRDLPATAVDTEAAAIELAIAAIDVAEAERAMNNVELAERPDCAAWKAQSVPTRRDAGVALMQAWKRYDSACGHVARFGAA